MAKIKTTFVCTECGAHYPRWTGRCEQCGNWNTLTEEFLSDGKPGAVAKDAKARKVDKISDIKNDFKNRLKTNITEVDQVLGGGIVPGALILLGGDPGIGKSTLVLDIASKVKNVLYVSGEESPQQIKIRAERLGISDGISLLSETNVDSVIATAHKEKPQLLVVDSIQTMYSSDIESAPGNVGQLSLVTSKLMNLAKENNLPVIIIGHVTKAGSIAGPKVIEHLVDVVLYLEGDRFGAFRLLRGVKNRFGSTNEVGIFEMSEKGIKPVQNPSKILIAERAEHSVGSVVFSAIEGTRPLLCEIQALSSPTTFGYPKRTASGFDLNRLQLIAAVLQKRCGLNLSTQDIYLNIAGGIKISEPAADLAVAIAIASAFKNKGVKRNIAVFGEIGLSGEVRSVSSPEKRIGEAKKLGLSGVLMPNSSDVVSQKSFDIIKVKTVKEAIEKAL